MSNKKGFLYQQIKSAILEKIEHLSPHDRIPPRLKLMDEFDVTRTTIDRAISELIADGYLYSGSGSGTYVSGTYSYGGKAGKTENLTWAIIMPNVTQSVYNKIIRGVEDYCHERSIALIVCNSDNFIEKQNQYIYRMIERNVDGIIVAPAIRGEDDSKPYKELIKHNIPFVFCNRAVSTIAMPAVISNRFYGEYIVTKHLISLGYKKFGYISRPLNYSIMLNFQGFVTALEENNLDVNQELINTKVSHDDEERPGYDAAMEMLCKDNRPEAIVSFNDIIARNVYSAIVDSGFEVGKDIGLVGYNNADLCDMLPVKLTSVCFRSYETGQKSSEILLKMITEGKIPSNPIEILKPQLVIRESCGYPWKKNTVGV